MTKFWIGCDYDGSYSLFKYKPWLSVQGEYLPAGGDTAIPLRGRKFHDFLLRLKPGYLCEISLDITNPSKLLL